MLNCFTKTNTAATVIKPLLTATFPEWLAQQTESVKNWVKATQFTAKADTFCLIPNEQGCLSQVLFGIKKAEDFWGYGALPTALPVGAYRIEGISDPEQLNRIVMAWGLGAYQFDAYKKPLKTIAQLVIPKECDANAIENCVTAIYLVRDLINTPTEQMGPAELAQAAVALGRQFNAEITQLIGDDLLKHNYPTIYAVGRASNRAPRLVDLRWGDKHAPKITLVGKGVCFDSGGLNIKPAAQMGLMKKDMGGAAHALGLARMIMVANLPVRLRVLIPAVENVIAGNAYKPGDVIKTRQGLTVEIGNTDAEGRLVVCDALAEAVTEQPDLLLDFTTLTGAARVAVGTDIAAFFCNNENLATQLQQHADQVQDPVWRLPLYAPYRKMLDSSIADINNAGSSSYAGAITAALFLREFVPENIPWIHFDFMAWNLSARPGRPEGAEVNALRAMFAYLIARFK